MKRIAVLSTDNNPHYHFYTPIVEWCWNKLGWDVNVFVTEDAVQNVKTIEDITNKPTTTDVYRIPSIEGVRSNTLAQVVRHFVSDILDKEDYIMVQDIDLIPLKEWNPDVNVRTIWGWDLTGHSFIPVHYTGMTGDKWYELMGCTGDLKADMEREMKANGRAYQKEWEQYWDADWDILTQKVSKQKNKFNFIGRGMVSLAKTQGGNPGTNPASTARGRIDRYNYRDTMNQPEWIDMHCDNNYPASPEKWALIREVLVKTFGELPTWMDKYVEEHHNKYEK